jgi:hypothetical protein
VTEQIVQVSGDPQSPVLGRQARELGSCLSEREVPFEYSGHGERQDRHDHDRDWGDTSPRARQALMPGRHRDRHQQRGRRHEHDERHGPQAKPPDGDRGDVQAHDECRVVREGQLD